MKSNKKLSELTEFAKYIGEKVANIEMRQSLTSGLENDAIRALSQYAMAESSALPEGTFKKAFDFNKTSEPNTYYKNFFEKDIRRCEYELLKFFGRGQVPTSSRQTSSTRLARGSTSCRRFVPNL